jgi:hypothetical protein
MSPITSQWYELKLTWLPAINKDEPFPKYPANIKYNKYSLGVHACDKKPSNHEVVNKVFEHTLILANQLYDGANEIAKEVGNMTLCDGSPPRPNWEAVIVDTGTYSIDQLLEASKDVKHLA